MIKVIGIAFLSIVISSCGWQLKGNYLAVTKDMNINLLFDNLAPEVKEILNMQRDNTSETCKTAVNQKST